MKKTDNRPITQAYALFAILLVFLIGLPSEVFGQDKTGTLPPPSDGAPPHIQESDDPKSNSAEYVNKLQALVAGTLDPNEETAPLFIIALDQETNEKYSVDSLARRVSELETLNKRQLKKLISELDTQTPEKADTALFEVRAAFLALPPAERENILAVHESRRRELEKSRQEAEQKRLALEKRTLRADALQSFLAHELNLEANPHALLKVDLLDPSEIILNKERRTRFLQGTTTGEEKKSKEEQKEKNEEKADVGASDVPENSEAEMDAQLALAARDLDTQRQRFLGLSITDRSDLFSKHKERIQDAQTAAETTAREQEDINRAEKNAIALAAEQARALEASKRARTEARRIIEEERARLLGVKVAQTDFEGELAKIKTEIRSDRENALSWRRKVLDLESRSILDGDRENDADSLYEALIQKLVSMRQKLRASLSVNASSSNVPSVDDHEAISIPKDNDDRGLVALTAELKKNQTRLREKEKILRREQTAANRENTGIMNAARLKLFTMLSKNKRAQITGFGPDGVQQARREVEQIKLETLYHLSALPYFLEKQWRNIRISPVPLLLLILKLLAAIIVFRWWRKRAERTLDVLREMQLENSEGNIVSESINTFLWYVKQVRNPIEWLLLTYIINQITSGFLTDYPEVGYIWTILWKIVLWSLLGSSVVSILDAISERQGKSTKTSSALRFRSLRLIGISVVGVALMLSLAKTTVGQAAIYSWVISTCWFLSIPIALIQTAWWKPTIFVRASAQVSTSPLLRWVTSQKAGIMSYPAAVIGGSYLLGDGLYRFFIRQAAHLSITKRFLAYLFRREVEKHASQTHEDNRYIPIDGKVYESLAPVKDKRHVVESYMRDEVKVVRDLVRSDNNTVIALIGERGLGKTTFIERVYDGFGEDEYLYVSCVPGGFDLFIPRMRLALGLPDKASEDEIISELRSRNLKAVFVDNAHRLIRPLIGGLQDIDALIHFARKLGPTTSWLISIESPAWRYLSRARGDRAVFDEQVTLESWNETEISNLISVRTSATALKPSFKKLVVPRKADARELDGEDRTRRDFFRLLTDYSDGNPVVSLHFWRESLFKNTDDNEIYVRLFNAPSPSALEDLPSTVYFVLRAIIQLEFALEADIVKCTDLRPAEVADALRSAKSRGYIEYRGDRFRIALPWYRAVTHVLKRQHLLIL